MNPISPKQKNLESQLKRIAKRSAQEMFCVSLILARGYKVQFIKPRQSKKVKPFLVIKKIFKGKEVLFDLSDYDVEKIAIQMKLSKTAEIKEKEEKDNSINDKKKYKPETKEITTSIVMNELIKLINDETTKAYRKKKTQYYVNPTFVWLSSIHIKDRIFNKKDIIELGEMMFEVIEESMKSDKRNQVFDYSRFVNHVNPSKNEKLVEFFNLVEESNKWVFIPIPREIEIKVERTENEHDWKL